MRREGTGGRLRVTISDERVSRLDWTLRRLCRYMKVFQIEEFQIDRIYNRDVAQF